MDNEEFRKRLSEIAEWRIPTDADKPYAKPTKKRGRKSNEEKYQEKHEEVFLEMFDGVNPTAPILLTKVKIQPSVCGDCGVLCDEGQRKEKKFYLSPVRHWRERCVTCDKVKNPETGEFDITSAESGYVYRVYLLKNIQK